jgi:1-acyl-sn-glycerol-3-phosphate acyltransferase
LPFINFFFKQTKAIPIAGRSEDRVVYEESFQIITKALNEEQKVVCFFPEGGISFDGKLQPLKKGILQILEKDNVPVVPVMINGMWGSCFSRAKKFKQFSFLKRRKVVVTVGEPIYLQEDFLLKLQQSFTQLENL